MRFDRAMFDQARRTAAGGADASPEATLETLVGLSATARKDGLLALEAKADGLDSFAADGLRAIVDGTDPEALRASLVGGMEAGGASGRALLSRMMIAEGLMGIQAGAGTASLELRLSAYLGPDSLARALERVSASAAR